MLLRELESRSLVLYCPSLTNMPQDSNFERPFECRSWQSCIAYNFKDLDRSLKS